METFIPHLRRRQVETGHWALTEAPEQVNKFIVEWFEEVVFDAKSML
jgi:soluble epoxide hydrolase/lipid-phosphate phosphatase